MAAVRDVFLPGRHPGGAVGTSPAPQRHPPGHAALLGGRLAPGVPGGHVLFQPGHQLGGAAGGAVMGPEAGLAGGAEGAEGEAQPGGGAYLRVVGQVLLLQLLHLLVVGELEVLGQLAPGHTVEGGVAIHAAELAGDEELEVVLPHVPAGVGDRPGAVGAVVLGGRAGLQGWAVRHHYHLAVAVFSSLYPVLLAVHMLLKELPGGRPDTTGVTIPLSPTSCPSPPALPPSTPLGPLIAPRAATTAPAPWPLPEHPLHPPLRAPAAPRSAPSP